MVIENGSVKPKPNLQDIADHQESVNISLLSWLDTDEWGVTALVSAVCGESTLSSNVGFYS